MVPLPELGLNICAPAVFLHGDFSSGNVQYDRERDKLVIIDWSTAYPVMFRPESQGGVVFLEIANLGPGYFDAATFMLSLMFRRPGAAMRVPDVEQHVRTFLLSYFAAAQYPWRAEEFACYFDDLKLLYLRLQRSLLGQSRFLVYRTSLWKVDRFVSSVRRDLEAMAADKD